MRYYGWNNFSETIVMIWILLKVKNKIIRIFVFVF